MTRYETSADPKCATDHATPNYSPSSDHGSSLKAGLDPAPAFVNTQPSRTGDQDPCVSLDLPRQMGQAITLAHWAAVRPLAAILWTHTSEDFRMGNLEVVLMAVTTHAFRHGAAPSDIAARGHRAERVTLRGNLRSNAATKKCGKSVMRARELQTLSLEQHHRCGPTLTQLRSDYERLFARLFERVDRGSSSYVLTSLVVRQV